MMVQALNRFSLQLLFLGKIEKILVICYNMLNKLIDIQ